MLAHWALPCLSRGTFARLEGPRPGLNHQGWSGSTNFSQPCPVRKRGVGVPRPEKTPYLSLKTYGWGEKGILG